MVNASRNPRLTLEEQHASKNQVLNVENSRQLNIVPLYEYNYKESYIRNRESDKIWKRLVY